MCFFLVLGYGPVGPGRSARPIKFYGPFGQAVRPWPAASFGPSALFLKFNKNMLSKWAYIQKIPCLVFFDPNKIKYFCIYEPYTDLWKIFYLINCIAIFCYNTQQKVCDVLKDFSCWICQTLLSTKFSRLEGVIF